MRLVALAAALALLSGCTANPAPPVAEGESFEDGFDDKHDLTGWENRAGRWELWDEPTAPSQPHALNQSRGDLDEPAILLSTGHGTFGSVDVRVAFRLLESSAPGAGVVVRFVDAENYYVVHSGDRGGLVLLEEYHQGERAELARASRSFDGGPWALLDVRVQGDRFTVTIDSDQLFTAHDATLQVGHVGLWTPPAARAQFDGMEVSRL